MSEVADPFAFDEEGATAEDIINLMIRAQLGRLSVCCPGVVRAFNASTQVATVQPVLRARLQGEAVRLPPISGVPVVYPAGGGYAVTFPLEVGDTVLLVFADRSLDEWEATGGEDVTPQDPRRFDITDAVAIPGLRSPANPLADGPIDGLQLGTDRYANPDAAQVHKHLRIDADGVSLRVEQLGGDVTRLRVTSDGKIEAGNGDDELLAIVSDLLALLSDGATPVVNTTTGQLLPSITVPAAALKTKLDRLKV